MADYQTLVEETDHIVDDERAKKPVTGAEKASVEPNIISASATQAKNPAATEGEKTDRHVHDDVESAKNAAAGADNARFGPKTTPPPTTNPAAAARGCWWCCWWCSPSEEGQNPDESDSGPPVNMELLHPFVKWYFFVAGQWFAPVSGTIKSKNLSRKAWRLAYSVYQAAVVAFMWSFFLYSMGIFSPLRTLEEVDWLCPLTDIKNMAYGLCWIVNQHTGLAFFLWSNLEDLLKQLSITKEDIRKRASSSSIFWFMVWSVILLFTVPIGLHVAQMVMPDFMSVPSYRDGKITAIRNVTFPVVQVVFDTVFYAGNRFFALPVFYAFLNMLFFLNCEVEKFKEELETGRYPSEGLARRRAIKVKKLIKDTEKAFRFFLTLYIAMLLLISALEVFSIVEEIETVITSNHTVHFLPASATTSLQDSLQGSLQTLGLTQEHIKAFPHSLLGKRSYPYVLVIIPPGMNHSQGARADGPFRAIPNAKTIIDQYKLKTQEIIVTAILDITQNVVLYALPLYKMSTLKSCLKSVLEAVEDSDHGEEDTGMNNKIFNTRQDKKDFKAYFRDNCTSGIRVLGREVSFLWTLVLTFFGPFAVVVVNLMFKHIHVESPWH